MSEISRPYPTTQGGAALLEAALGYLRRGWTPIPIKRGTKKPLIRWKRFQAERPTLDEVRGWWRRWPDANVGLVTGKPGEIVVLDSDALDVEPPPGKGWGVTASVLTRRGVHRYYSTPASGVPTINAFRESLDLKGEKGYVVAPPSAHTTGHLYTWELSPDDVPPAPLPRWVTELVQERQAAKESRRTAVPLAAEEVRALIVAAGLRDSGDGTWYRGRCPRGTHRDAHPSFGLNTRGGWVCSCGSGTLRQLAQELGVPFAPHRQQRDAEEEARADDLLVDETPPPDAPRGDPEAAGDGEGTPSGDGMSSAPSQHHRTPTCWRCKAKDLDNGTDPICLKCRWVRCPHCGACSPGCTEGTDDIGLIKRRHLERAEAAIPVVGEKRGTLHRSANEAERAYALSFAPGMALASWLWEGNRGWLRRQRLAALDALTEQAAGAGQAFTGFRVPLDEVPDVGKPTSRGRGRLNTLRRRIERLGADAVIIRARGEAHVLVAAPELMAGGEAVPSDEVYAWLVDRIKDAMPPRYMSPARAGEKAITGVGAWKLTVLEEERRAKKKEEEATTEQPGAPAPVGGRPGTAHAEVTGDEDAGGGVFLPDIALEEVEELAARVEERLPCFRFIASRPAGLYLDAEGGLKVRPARWVWKDTVAATEQEFLAHVRQLDRHFGMVHAGAWGKGRTRKAA